MKKLLPIFFSAVTLTAFGQTKEKDSFRSVVQNHMSTESAVNYTFSQTTATYASLTGATDINAGMIWDDPDVRIAMPFNLWVNGNFPDSLDFYFSLGTTLGAYDYSATSSFGVISPFETDVIDRGTGGTSSLSTIQYKVDGSSPNRILKIEWKNCGNYDEWDNFGTTNDYVNFQVWIHETTGVIEFHYGASQINNLSMWLSGGPGTLIGIANLTFQGDIIDAHMLRGAPANPSMVDSVDLVTNFPSNGTVYRFSPLTVGLEENDGVDLVVFPTPATDRVSIKTTETVGAYRILDISGREVQQGRVEDNSIELGSLSSGAYFLRLEVGEKWVHRRLMVE